MVRVLFVCSGNICRSPTAEGIFRALVDQAGLSDLIHCDSAGLHDYHQGDPPDPRSQAIARERGYRLDGQRSRPVQASDFIDFDLILAMDRSHLHALKRLAPPSYHGRVELFLDGVVETDWREVPDPYYGNGGRFTFVFDLIESGCSSRLERLRAELPNRPSS